MLQSLPHSSSCVRYACTCVVCLCTIAVGVCSKPDAEPPTQQQLRQVCVHVCNVSVYMSLELYVCVKASCRASHTAAAASGMRARV